MYTKLVKKFSFSKRQNQLYMYRYMYILMIKNFVKLFRYRDEPIKYRKKQRWKTHFYPTLHLLHNYCNENLIYNFAVNNDNKIFSYINNITSHNSIPTTVHLNSTTASLDWQSHSLQWVLQFICPATITLHQ